MIKTWHSSSTERKNCLITRRKTGTYIKFDAYGIVLEVPVASDADYDLLVRMKHLIAPLMKAQSIILKLPKGKERVR